MPNTGNIFLDPRVAALFDRHEAADFCSEQEKERTSTEVAEQLFAWGYDSHQLRAFLDHRNRARVLS
jgi:hypothetical protein